jgi:hypothetical protein
MAYGPESSAFLFEMVRAGCGSKEERILGSSKHGNEPFCSRKGVFFKQTERLSSSQEEILSIQLIN